MRRRRAPQPRTDTAWEDLLFPLHAATEVGALWRATHRLLRAAFAPCARVTLFLGHFGMREARLVFTDPPIRRAAAWYRERGRINPFTPYIRTHRRVTHYLFRDVVGPRDDFVRTEFYRRFARVEGWEDGLSGLFWNGDEVKSMFSVYRAREQPAFTAADGRRVEALRPHVETAIDRVQKLQAERLHRRVLEEFNRSIPVGLVLLDWDLATVFANNEALRQCARWNHGRAAARGLASRDWLELPPAVRSVCAALREEILRLNAKDRLTMPAGVRRVEHPALRGCAASVSVLHASPGLLAKPGFMLVFEDRGGEEAPVAALAPERARLLWALTSSEREVALAMLEGASNAEIAARLRKSPLTIKKQVTAIFAKLGVPSRARLIARLR